MQVDFLGKTFEVTREFIRIGGFSIYWYAIFIMIGFIVAFVYAMRRAEEFGVSPDKLFDCVIVGIISAIIGARSYYVIFNFEQFSGDLKRIFYIHEGGIAIYGAVIGALLGGGIMCYIKKVNVLAAFDLASVGFMFGQAIGRWGNFINQEAFGSKISSDSFLSVFGMRSDNTDRVARYGEVHPCFFYESIWCLLGFILLHTISKKRKFNGQLFYIYMIWYGIGRFFIEGLRTDSLYIGNSDIRVSQVVAIFSVLAGIVLLVLSNKKHKRDNQPVYEGVFGEIDENDFQPYIKMSSNDIIDEKTDSFEEKE